MRRLLTPRLALLSLAHFSIDAYSSFLAPLLPLLIAKLHLSLTQVGSLVALASMSSSLSQPLFGWISDRIRRPWFVAFGPLVAAVFLSSVGVAPHFAGLAALVMLGGVGVAAFHPQAAVLATSLSARRSIAMAFFVGGGTFGYALGPLGAVSVVGAVGLERTWVAALPGLVVAALLLAWFMRVAPRSAHAGSRPTLAELKPVLRPLVLLYFAVVCRAAVGFSFMTFLPVHLHAAGYSVGAGGAVLTTYLLCGAVGGFAGGWFADRLGGRRVVRFSFIGAFPLYAAFLILPATAGLVCAFLGNFVLQSSLPVNVVMGQELSPRHSSTISSLLMGAAWGFGALIAGPVGMLADARGLHTALSALIMVLLGGFACAMALPETHRAVGPVEIAQPSAVGETPGS